MLTLCRKCGVEPLASGSKCWCRTCYATWERGYYARNRTKCLAKATAQRAALRVLVFQAYGGPVCRCCGEREDQFLCIDHVEGGGNTHRKSIGRKAGTASFYHWLKKNNFPPGFQVLCFNCNMSKHKNKGLCVHQIKAAQAIAGNVPN
jgi:hypothetical protein